MATSKIDVSVLVDYDNLRQHQKRHGLEFVCEQIAERSLQYLPAGVVRFSFRFYGGWYEDESLTEDAKKIIVEIGKVDQKVYVPIIEKHRESRVAFHAEVARATVEFPEEFLFNTYRRKGVPNGLRFCSPCDVSCKQSPCGLEIARAVVRKQKCISPGCSVARADLVSRGEQKMIDTMLACDINHLASSRGGHICVVSGDDDLNPPIRSALGRGAAVVRLYPAGVPVNRKSASAHQSKYFEDGVDDAGR